MQNPAESKTLRFNGYICALACVILLTTTVAITLSALGRYFFRHPIALIAQGTYYLMPSVIALSLGYTLLRGGHVGATILIDLFPAKIKRVAVLAGSILVFIFSFFFCWAGFLRVGMAWKGNEYLPGFPEIPLLPFTVIPVIGFLFLFLAAAADTAKSFKDLLHRTDRK